jgi:leucyl aminopeptidase (aminopeptidase T)
MGFEKYKKFVFESCKLFESDSKTSWKQLSGKQEELCEWLNGRSRLILHGPNIDLKMSIKDRLFINENGKENFPGGEIFISPVENSINGWVRFSYPAIFENQEIIDVELWFEMGSLICEFRVYKLSCRRNITYPKKLCPNRHNVRYFQVILRQSLVQNRFRDGYGRKNLSS